MRNKQDITVLTAAGYAFGFTCGSGNRQFALSPAETALY
jgi:hypothetical protein